MPEIMRLIAEHHKTIVSFAEEHSEIITNKFSGLDGKQKQQQLWEQLMLKLNSLGFGVLSVSEYKRRIVDWKSKVKAKAVDVQRSLSRTGGGERMLKALTKIEQRLLAIMGNKSYEGDHNREMGFAHNPSFQKFLDSVPIPSTSQVSSVYSFDSLPQKPKKLKINIPSTVTSESFCPMLSSNHTSSPLNTDTSNVQYSYEDNSNVELVIEEDNCSIENITGMEAASEISKKPSISTRKRKNLTSMTDSIKKMNSETLNVLKSMDSNLQGINENLKSINESLKKLCDYIELKF